MYNSNSQPFFRINSSTIRAEHDLYLNPSWFGHLCKQAAVVVFQQSNK